MKHLRPILVLTALSPIFTGCGGAAPVAARAETAPTRMAMEAPSPPPLDHSLYGRDANGSIGEQDLQKVLEAPIDLELPARVGVIPLAAPFDPKSTVAIATRTTASREITQALAGNPSFSLVTDVSTELPNAGGLEGLRVIAARYRMRYLILYSERFEDATHLNGWAWTYPTIVGMLFVPGVTVQSHGLAQADLMDVRTGTILFSVVEPIEVKSMELMIGAAREHRAEQGSAAGKAAKRVAARVVSETEALVAFADAAAKGENRSRTRLIPAPVVAGVVRP
jgi:rhombotail lipoprotein